MANTLVLATAGLKPDQLADTEHIRYSRVDYLELQRLIDADVLNYTAYDGTKLGRLYRYLETQIRSDLYLALWSVLIKSSYKTIFAMSERVGIPLAGVYKAFHGDSRFVAMFQCWSQRQERTITGLNLLPSIDTILVHCNSMKRHLVKLGASAERVHVIPYSRDHRFFSLQSTEVKQQSNFAISVGETRSRDYGSLFQAVGGLPVELLVAASGAWDAREKNMKISSAIPQNTTIVKHIPLLELRELYARAQFVVIPVHETVFSAGATVVLEAMSMCRAVIATRSPGLLDYIVDGETGILVEPGDIKGWREAIQYLLSHPIEARRMGQNGRQRVEQELNLDTYVERLANILQPSSIKPGDGSTSSRKSPLPCERRFYE